MNSVFNLRFFGSSCAGHGCIQSRLLDERGYDAICVCVCVWVSLLLRGRQIVGLRGVDGHGCYEALGEVQVAYPRSWSQSFLRKPGRGQACSSQVECAERDCAASSAWAAWAHLGAGRARDAAPGMG